MKTFLALIVLCTLVGQVHSQEFSPFEEPIAESDKPGQPATEEPAPQSEKEKQEATSTDKKFKLHVFLNEPLGGRATIESQNVAVQVRKPVVETKRVDGREIKETRYVTEQVAKTIETVTAGATIIDCDAIEVQVKTDQEDNVSYEFEIQGQLQLRNGNSKIEAQSAKLSEGKLTLTEVTATTGGINMKSSEVVIDLNVGSFRIGDYHIPATPLNSTPFDNFAPTPAGNAIPFYNESASDDFAPTFPSSTIPRS